MKKENIEKPIDDKLIQLLTITTEFLIYSSLNQQILISVQANICQEKIIFSSIAIENTPNKRITNQIVGPPKNKNKNKKKC